VSFLASRLGLQLAQAGVQLASEEQRSAALAAYSDDVIRCLSSGLVTIDSQGTIRTFNGAAAEITGVSGREATGQTLATVLPNLAELLGRAGVDGELRREVITHVRDGGERVLGVSGSPLTNPRGEHVGYIVNFQDLTDLRRMENQVKRGERLAAVGQMAAGVAHEIRNPLASISGSIELLKMTPTLDPDSTALMEIVLREVDRLNGLISEMLDYARPRERMPATLEPAVLLEETLRVFSQDRTHSAVTCSLEIEASAKGLELSADPAQIRQVVWNLLRNAAESMPEGGPISVYLRVAEGADSRWAEIEVVDRGRGMTAAELDRLFEPFFTTKSRGTGLGLATVHRIVSEHGGEIVVESEPGEGTHVGVRLPLGTPAAPTYTPAMITTERSGPATSTGPVAPWKGHVS
jgi:two-component system sensor histidine kinase PilS (NtrC family)